MNVIARSPGGTTKQSIEIQLNLWRLLRRSYLLLAMNEFEVCSLLYMFRLLDADFGDIHRAFCCDDNPNPIQITLFINLGDMAE